MELTEILSIPGLPTLQGVAGEVEALKYIYECRACNIDVNLLLGISGVLFRFFVPTDPTTITEESLSQYLEIIDGPEPTRLAARFSGWNYVPHLQNSVNTYFKKAIEAIQKDIPAITRGSENPSVVNMILGYTLNRTNPNIKKLFLKSINNALKPIEIVLPSNPEHSIIEKNQWRNFIGVSEFIKKTDKQHQAKELKLALTRTLRNTKPHFIGDGFWVAGESAYEKVKELLEFSQTKKLGIKMLMTIFKDYQKLRTKLAQFINACAEEELADFSNYYNDSLLLPKVAGNILELLEDFGDDHSLKIDQIVKEVDLLKITEYKLIENLAFA